MSDLVDVTDEAVEIAAAAPQGHAGAGQGAAGPASPSYTAREILGPGGVIARQLAGYEHRDSQLQMADVVERALSARTDAIIEAGTGTGKSLAYLVPAILSGHRTLVSTADKSLQAQIVGKDLPFLHAVLPVPFTAVLLKGRGNYICLREFDRAQNQIDGGLEGFEGFRSPESAQQWPALREWVLDTPDGDLEALPFQVAGELRELVTADSDTCIGEACPFNERCHSERAKRAAQTADIVVVNHALLLRDLDIRYQSEGHASVVPDAEAIVLDEAHHTEDVATDAFGAEVTAARWKRLAGRIERLTVKHRAAKGDLEAEAQSWALRLAAIERSLNALLSAVQGRLEAARLTVGGLGDERPYTRPLAVGLEDLAEAIRESAPAWLGTDERASWGKLPRQLGVLAQNVEALGDPETRGYVRYAELGPSSRLVLHIKPIEVADELRARLWEMRTGNAAADAPGRPVPVIATSATLATDGGMGYWRERVGCDDAAELIVSSPFDYARAALLYLPTGGADLDSSRYRQAGSTEYFDRLAAEIESLLLASAGRAFCLFTSVRALDEASRRLAPRLRAFTVLRQGELPRPELVRRFREDGHAILFGVKSFWEGVDVPGDALSLVVIDKLPFAPPDDPVWAAKCAALNRRRGSEWAWFSELAVPSAIIQLKQGFGRLIRSREDRGAVAILDGRLTTKGYGARIVRALPPATVTRSLDAVKAFFAA